MFIAQEKKKNNILEYILSLKDLFVTIESTTSKIHCQQVDDALYWDINEYISLRN